MSKIWIVMETVLIPLLGEVLADVVTLKAWGEKVITILILVKIAWTYSYVDGIRTSTGTDCASQKDLPCISSTFIHLE